MSGMAGLHAGHGDHRRLARASAWHRRRHRARPQAQEVAILRLQPVLRRRARRGLDLGSRHVGGPLEARQPDRHRRRQQPCRPTAPRPACSPSSRCGPKCEAFGWHVQRVDGNDIEALVARLRRRARTWPSRSRASSSATPRWRRACRSWRPASKTTSCGSSSTNGRRRIEALDAGRTVMSKRRNPDAARAALGRAGRRRPGPGEAAPHHLGDDRLARGARASAPSPAPFGHALVELAETRPEIVGMTADLGKYTDLHIFAKAYPDRFYQMGMAEQLLMARPPAWRARASCPSPPPTRCSPRAGPTTSSARRSPRRT